MAVLPSNPYSPPEEVTAPRRMSSLAANVLTAALLLVLSVRAFRAMVYLGVMSPWDMLRDTATWLTPETLGVSWAVTRPFLAFAFASFCIWIYRANRDARSLGASEMAFSPTWAVAVGFIPVVNLIGPYRAVKEIYQASAVATPSSSGRFWREARVPLTLPLWWGFWICSLAWTLVPYPTLTPTSAVWGQAVLEVLRATAALLLIVIVRAIEHLQSGGAPTKASRRGELSPSGPRRD